MAIQRYPYVGEVIYGENAFSEGLHLEEGLGIGGQATVYGAIDLNQDRKVAVKIFGKPESDAALQSIEDEGRLTLNWRHENILQTYAYQMGLIALNDGLKRPMIVMERAKGGSLHDYLQAHGKLESGDAVDKVAQIAAAVDYAHKKGVVHRDIKPANALLSRNDVVKLTDFGIAVKAYGAGEEFDTQNFSGTFGYAPPEQVYGKAVKESDIFALAVILHYFISGQNPPPRNPPGPLSQIEGLSVTRQMRAIEEVFATAFNPDPALRPGDAGQFRCDLLYAYKEASKNTYPAPNWQAKPWSGQVYPQPEPATFKEEITQEKDWYQQMPPIERRMGEYNAYIRKAEELGIEPIGVGRWAAGVIIEARPRGRFESYQSYKKRLALAAKHNEILYIDHPRALHDHYGDKEEAPAHPVIANMLEEERRIQM